MAPVSAPWSGPVSAQPHQGRTFLREGYWAGLLSSWVPCSNSIPMGILSQCRSWTGLAVPRRLRVRAVLALPLEGTIPDKSQPCLAEIEQVAGHQVPLDVQLPFDDGLVQRAQIHHREMVAPEDDLAVFPRDVRVGEVQVAARVSSDGHGLFCYVEKGDFAVFFRYFQIDVRGQIRIRVHEEQCSPSCSPLPAISELFHPDARPLALQKIRGYSIHMNVVYSRPRACAW